MKERKFEPYYCCMDGTRVCSTAIPLVPENLTVNLGKIGPKPGKLEEIATWLEENGHGKKVRRP